MENSKGIDYIGAGCGCLIVNDKNQILLLSHNKFEGKWSQPGGSIEFGETVEVAIKREIMEELGVEVELFGPKMYGETIETIDGRMRHWLVGGRFAKIVSGEPKNLELDKHADMQRFDLDDLPEEITLFTKPYIERYKERIIDDEDSWDDITFDPPIPAEEFLSQLKKIIDEDKNEDKKQ